MKKLLLCTFILITLIGASHADQQKPLRMAYLQNDIHHLAFWVALEKDYFKLHGADVEVTGVFRAGPEIMTAFAAGALDMAYVGEAPATTAVANKAAKAVVLAQVNTEGSALVVNAEDSGIAKLADLKGKTVAVPGHSTVQDFLLKKALKKHQVNLKQINIVVIKPPEMISALRTRQVDAFIAWEPYPSQAITMGSGRHLLTSHQMWADHPCCVLVADTKFFKAHPKKAQAVVRAHVQATDFINQHPDEAAKIGVKYTGLDEDTVRQAMKTVKYTYHLSIAGEKEYVRFLSELRYIRVNDPDRFVADFINPQPLKELTE